MTLGLFIFHLFVSVIYTSSVAPEEDIIQSGGPNTYLEKTLPSVANSVAGQGTERQRES